MDEETEIVWGLRMLGQLGPVIAEVCEDGLRADFLLDPEGEEPAPDVAEYSEAMVAVGWFYEQDRGCWFHPWPGTTKGER